MHQQVLEFWFDELEPEMWWQKSPALDTTISERFGSLHRRAVQCEFASWRGTAHGSLAEIILIDQFSRNIYRDQARAFAYDPLALALSQTAIAKGFDDELSKSENCFLYIPFMHSESAQIHEQAVALYTKLGNPVNLEFELKHKVIIDRFGRYPHRNKILGRDSTEEEIEFLKQPDSGF